MSQRRTTYPSPSRTHVERSSGLFLGVPDIVANSEVDGSIAAPNDASRVLQQKPLSEGNDIKAITAINHHLVENEDSVQRAYTQRVAQGVMSLADSPSVEYTNQHDFALNSRKRSKISRACDECRRKKVVFR